MAARRCARSSSTAQGPECRDDLWGDFIGVLGVLRAKLEAAGGLSMLSSRGFGLSMLATVDAGDGRPSGWAYNIV